MIGTELVEGSTALSSLEHEWRELAENSRLATPFQTWEWHSTWFKHYGSGKKPLVLAVREGKDLIGLAPFAQNSTAWRVLRWSGGGPSDYLQPICRSGSEAVVNERLAEFVYSSISVDLVDLHQIRENQPLANNAPAQEKIDQATCLVLDLPDSFDAYLKTIGKSLRYDVRKLDKELFASGKAKMEVMNSSSIEVGFQIFLEQHKARWRERKLPGAFVGRSLRFHREWVDIAVRKGWLRLKVLRVDGTPVGAIYAMQFGQTLYYYQAGFDPEFKSLSPGTLLVADSIRSGIEEGVKHFDFMRGAEAYKRRWKPQHEFHNYRVLFAKASPRGAMGLKWNEFANQIEMKLRLRLESGGGS